MLFQRNITVFSLTILAVMFQRILIVETCYYVPTLLFSIQVSREDIPISHPDKNRFL